MIREVRTPRKHHKFGFYNVRGAGRPVLGWPWFLSWFLRDQGWKLWELSALGFHPECCPLGCWSHWRWGPSW